MNFENKTPKQPNDLIESGFNPEILLSDFYRKLYIRDKHDSPDESRTSLIRRINKLIIENQISPKMVLNIGSGPQALEKQILNKSQGGQLIKKAQFVSIDLAQIIPTKLLCSKMKDVQHIRGNAIKLPFKDKTFGLVISNHAIDFCPQESAFKEALRVLNNNGKGIFYLHHPSMLREFPENETISIFWQYLKDNSILFQNEKDIKNFLEKIGFSVKEILLKNDAHKRDTWWEVVVEKDYTKETL
ncbi:MAG: methyltransferase domain-containing protein [Candidatus Paceibacterota bacterium]|jgi:ubiquinone/menaquinone biosynthesis C-methylase UbiE